MSKIVIKYRDYKKFNEETFKTDLKNALKSTEICEYKPFENIFLSVLEKHAPLKETTIRANHAPCMTKVLRKAIMRRSNPDNKERTAKTKSLYRKQRNYFSRLYKKERKKYYAKLELKNITDNKLFSKTIKPFLSDKGSKGSKITLVDNKKNIISSYDDQEVSETLNNFFKSAVDSLGIEENKFLLENTDDLRDLGDPIDIAIKKFDRHPSIRDIKKNISLSSFFNFSYVTKSDMEEEIANLNINKASTSDNIPTKHVKGTSNICNELLHKIWNN